MGYYYTTEPENAVPGNSCAQPKTHVPASPVKDRGLRYYQPETGRWASRDPIGEKAFYRWYVKEKTIEMRQEWSRRGKNPVYLFVNNDAIDQHDALGLTGTTSTSFDPCQASGIDAGFQGGTVCYKGTEYPCVWAKNWPGGKITTPAVLKCAQLHEKTHIENSSKFGEPCDPKSCEVKRGTSKEGKHEEDECTAWKATADCLEKIVIEGEPAEDYLWIVAALGTKIKSCKDSGKWPK
jgi:hypothetical protein